MIHQWAVTVFFPPVSPSTIGDRTGGSSRLPLDRRFKSVCPGTGVKASFFFELEKVKWVLLKANLSGGSAN